MQAGGRKGETHLHAVLEALQRGAAAADGDGAERGGRARQLVGGGQGLGVGEQGG